MSEKKFTEEEMKKLRSIQQTYFEIQKSFGKVKIARMNLNTQIDDFQEDEDDMEKYFKIGEGESCVYSNIEEFIADVEFEKVSNINKEALKLSQSQSKMDELRDIVR